MTAKEMFEELGYEKWEVTGCTIYYNHKTDYINKTVIFHLDGMIFPRTYEVIEMEWQDNRQREGWIPMEERREDLKHCATYGHMQRVEYPMNVSLHKAINKQIEELGWK